MKTVTRENIEKKIGSVEIAERNAQAGLNKVNAGMSALKQIPLGQPKIIGRPDIYKAPLATIDSGMKQSAEWGEKAENRRELTEKVERAFDKGIVDVAVSGKTAYASVGAKTSVNNLDFFRAELAELETAAAQAKENNKKIRKIAKMGLTVAQLREQGYINYVYSFELRGMTEESIPKPFHFIAYDTQAAKIKDRREKITKLERMKEIDETGGENEALQALIDGGTLTQWQKQPVYYFVNGMKKTAVMKTPHGFVISDKYSPSEENKETVQNIIDILNKK